MLADNDDNLNAHARANALAAVAAAKAKADAFDVTAAEERKTNEALAKSKVGGGSSSKPMDRESSFCLCFQDGRELTWTFL